MSEKASAKYPIFLQCTAYTLDEYWIDILRECSLGKFPKGLTILHNNTMRVTVGKKKYEMIPMHDDPLEMFKLCMEVFKSKLGMTSSRDHKAKNKHFEHVKSQNAPHLHTTWDEVKKHKVEKDSCLNDYVLRLQRRHDLTTDETIHVARLIRCGLLFKSIDSKSIEFDDGRIVTISNLKYNSKTRQFGIAVPTKKGGALKLSSKSTNDNPLKKEVQRYIEKINIL